MQNSATSSSLTTLHLRHDSSISQTTSVIISHRGGVDIGLVAGALGLNPSSVRLNGYYISSMGLGHVSSGLSWVQLLDFFAQRGLPRGLDRHGDAIVVQGKSLRHTDNNHGPLKRKVELEVESCVKKKKLESPVEFKNKIVSTKRRLSLEDSLESSFLKKIKIADCDTGTQESCTGTHLVHAPRGDHGTISVNIPQMFTSHVTLILINLLLVI